jgi:hypothetical protein
MLGRMQGQPNDNDNDNDDDMDDDGTLGRPGSANNSENAERSQYNDSYTDARRSGENAEEDDAAEQEEMDEEIEEEEEDEDDNAKEEEEDDEEEEEEEEEDVDTGFTAKQAPGQTFAKDEPPVQLPMSAAERAMEKARAVERLRRKKIRYGGPNSEYASLITFTEEELPAMSTKKLLELDSMLTHRLRSETSIKLYRRIVMQAVVLVQNIVMAYPHVFRANLEGWKEEFWRDIDQMDHILFDIYDQYGDKAPENPIITLLVQVATHGMMFNITKQMVTAQQSFIAPQHPTPQPTPTQPIPRPPASRPAPQAAVAPPGSYTAVVSLPRMTQQQMLPMNMAASRLHIAARPPPASLPPGSRMHAIQEEMPEPDLSQLPAGQLLAHMRQQHELEHPQLETKSQPPPAPVTVPIPSAAMSEPIQPLDVRSTDPPIGAGSRAIARPSGPLLSRPGALNRNA